jgi:N-acyl-D-amino-acid deacylase
MFDLVIRHGTVIDGSNAPRRQADVAIDQGRIVEVGHGIGRGREEIDATGRIVAPGFIDAHTHDDLAMLVQPHMRPKISQGVTTCVCGNCGVSLGPLPDGPLPEPLNLLADGPGTRFPSAAAYLDALRGQACAVNSVPLLGHSALRATLMDRTDRAADAREVAAMNALVDEALRAGYHGVSTGTFYAGAAHATTDEVIGVLAPLSRHGGVFATHMRDEGEHVLRSIDETAAIGRALGVTTIVSHHKVAGLANHGRSTETLSRIARHRDVQSATPGFDLVLDCYPYAASSTVLRADRVRAAERTLLTSCDRLPHFVGRDVAQIATELGLSIEAACEHLQPAGAVYFAMNEADVERILAWPATMIGSDGIPLQARPHPRLWGTFPRVLGHYCRGRGLFPLETAVHKMTGLTAARFGLADRGLIAPGMAADVTVFDAEAVIDRATFDEPEQDSAGIEWVVVNGQVAWAQGQAGALAGRLLPRGAARRP